MNLLGKMVLGNPDRPLKSHKEAQNQDGEGGKRACIEYWMEKRRKICEICGEKKSISIGSVDRCLSIFIKFGFKLQ